MFAIRVIVVLNGICLGSTLAAPDVSSSCHLLDNYISKRYELSLDLDPELPEFSAIAGVFFSIRTKTNSVYLHASPKRITDISRVFNRYQNYTCDYSYLDETPDILNITCEHPFRLPPYFNDIIISYKGLYETDDYTGFYKASYDTDKGKKHYAVTQFKPSSARTVFPCFDEPGFKNEFRLDVSYPESYTVLANAEFQFHDRQNGKPHVQFDWTPQIATYLIAFAISKFEKTSNTTTYPVSVYNRENQRHRTGTALKFTHHIVDSLAEWTKIKYTHLGMSKVDLVAVPEHALEANGNWGLLTFRESNLLDEGNKTSAQDKQNIITTIAHELAYQWFGGFVTFDSWSNAWLSDGFARYFQYHVPEKVMSERNETIAEMELERQFVPLVLHSALQSDGADAYPMSKTENDTKYTEADLKKFDAINSDKGATIIRMMKHILGENNFQAGMQKYFKNLEFKTASPKYLLETLSTVNENKNINFTEVMHNWIYESGYPLVTVSLNGTKNSIIISQKEFQPGHNKGDEDGKLWHIPLTFISSNNNISNLSMVWLTTETLKMELDTDDWIILNSQQIGHYRVNYDEELWHRIIFALKSEEMKNISVTNRAQLIDDAFALAKAGEIQYGLVFYLARYLMAETEFEPWYAAAKSLKYLLRVLDVHDDHNALENLKELVQDWVSRAYLQTALEPLTHLQELTNQILFDLRCHMGDKRCLKDAEKIFHGYKKTKHIEDYSTRGTALCFGLKQSQSVEDDYDMLMTNYAISESPIEKKAILSAMGCINDKMVLEKYLSQMLATDSMIPRTDAINVYKAIIANNQYGIDMALDFLKDHLQGIVDRYGQMADLSELILEPARWVVTDQQSKLLSKILKKYKHLQGIPAIQKKVRKELSFHKRWFEKYKTDIDAAVQSLKSKSSIAVSSMIVTLLSLLVILKL